MCHGNHGNYFSNYYPPSSSVYVDANEDVATDDEPFDLTDGVGGVASPDNYYGTYYTLSAIVVTAVSGNSGDQFSLDLGGTGLVLSEGAVSIDGVAFATVAGGVDGTPLTITPIASSGYGATYYGAFMTLIDSVRYTNDTSDAPFSRVVNIFVDYADTTDRSFDVTVNVQNGASIPELNLFGADHESLTPQGGDTLANTYTTSTQYQPSTATMSDGTSVVIWSSLGQDGSGYGVYGQLYDESGNKVGAEFRVNTSTTNNQLSGDVTALDDGGFVVTWNSNQSSGTQVYFQRFAADGTAAGTETLVGTVYRTTTPSVVDLEGGGFAIGWIGSGTSGGDAILVQRYSGAGVAMGPPITVSDTTAELEVVLAPLGDGFVATYRAYDGTSGNYQLYSARFDGTGAPIGLPMSVGDSSGNAHEPSVTELADGQFVLTWSTYSTTTYDYDVMARLYNADGTPAGAAFQISVTTGGQQRNPSVVALSDGGFAVSWYANHNHSNEYDVFVRTFDGEGQPTSGNVRVNSTTAGSQLIDSAHSLTKLPDGSLLVVFTSATDVYSRIVTHEDLAVGNVPPSADVEIPLILTWHDSEDGSETLQLVLSGYPNGATFSQGSAGDGGTWVIDVTDPSDLASLVMTPPRGWSGDFDLTVLATTTETSTGDTASDTLTFSVHVEYTNSDPDLTGSQAVLAAGSEDEAYTVTLEQLIEGFSDTDGDALTVDNLTADYGTISDNGDGTYTVTPSADYHGPVSLTYDVVDGNGGTVGASLGFSLASVNDAPTGSVTISGTAEQGQTLTASNDLADEDGMGTVTYQWLRNGEAIEGATGGTYVLTQTDVGANISVVANYTDGQGTAKSETSASIGAVTNVNDGPTGSVTVTGTASEGETLTASNTLADEDGMGTVTYQWLRDGAVIEGATGDTYVLTQADVGASFSVVASYTDGEGTVEEETSASTAAVTNVNDAPTGSVTISGTAEQGQTLTASNDLADEDGMGTVTYQWLRNGEAIEGATGGTYVLTQTDVGANISVVANYTDGQGTAESETSASIGAVTNVNDGPTGSVTVTGTASEGETLTASNTLADEDGMGTVTYQWLRDGAVIEGATGDTYVLTQADVGASFSVVASYTDGEGTVEEETSASTAAVTNVNDAPTGSVTISGTAEQGQTLTASNDLADEDGMGTVTYQWLRNGEAIEGATGGTYVLTQTDVGANISVVANYTDGQGTAKSETSASTAAVASVVFDTQIGTERGEKLSGDRNAADAYDLIYGRAGKDQIDGKSGDDILWGGSGDDKIWGGTGADKLHGEDGRDTIYGGDGSDWIEGGLSNDTAFGGNGDDELFGDDGNDVLRGEADNDTLVGGIGNDTLTGGAGADKFVFGAQGGRQKDVITDFSVGQDLLVLESGVSIVRQLEVRGSTVLILSSGAEVTLTGVALAEWNASPEDSIHLLGSTQDLGSM